MKYSEINLNISEYDKDSDLNLKKNIANKLSNSTKTIMMIPTSHEDKFQKA